MRARRRSFIGAGAVALSAALVGLGIFLARTGLGRADQYASVISLYVGILGLVASVIGTVLAVRQAPPERTGSTSTASTGPVFHGPTYNPIFADDSEVHIEQTFHQKD
jgi:hypothetical protein